MNIALRLREAASARAETRRRDDAAIEAGARAERRRAAAQERWPAERADVVPAFHICAGKPRAIHPVMDHDEPPQVLTARGFRFH